MNLYFVRYLVAGNNGATAHKFLMEASSPESADTHARAFLNRRGDITMTQCGHIGYAKDDAVDGAAIMLDQPR